MEQLKDDLNHIHKENKIPLIIDADREETLTIDMARSISQRGQQKSEGEALCIIRGFNIATIPAQNALLKIIESPARGVHFFLVTTQPGELLETIQSRVLRIHDLYSNDRENKVYELADSFKNASTLSERLAVIDKLQTKYELRELIQVLSETNLPRDNHYLGEAIELIADWGRDNGSSIKLLGQYLAIAAGRSLKGK
jgi:DNA polymerase III delta prime subunit